MQHTKIMKILALTMAISTSLPVVAMLQGKPSKQYAVRSHLGLVNNCRAEALFSLRVFVENTKRLCFDGADDKRSFLGGRLCDKGFPTLKSAIFNITVLMHEKPWHEIVTECSSTVEKCLTIINQIPSDTSTQLDDEMVMALRRFEYLSGFASQVKKLCDSPSHQGGMILDNEETHQHCEKLAALVIALDKVLPSREILKR